MLDFSTTFLAYRSGLAIFGDSYIGGVWEGFAYGRVIVHVLGFFIWTTIDYRTTHGTVYGLSSDKGNVDQLQPSSLGETVPKRKRHGGKDDGKPCVRGTPFSLIWLECYGVTNTTTADDQMDWGTMAAQ